MKVVVSACLLGENCKFSGGNNRSERLLSELAKHPEIEVIPVCPEVAGGLSTPRPPAEISGDRVLNIVGEDVTAAFQAGVEAEMNRVRADIEAGEIVAAVLQSRSPSCGVNEVYDGTFSSVLVPGNGLFAQALDDGGVKIIDAANI